MPKIKYLRLLVILALCMAPLIPLWYYAFPPLQDYGNHFARLTILREYDNSDFYAGLFNIKPFRLSSPLSLTYLTLDIFANKIMAPFSVNTAMKAFISLYVVLFLLSLYLISKQLDLDAAFLMLFSVPLIYSSFFHFGFLNFLFSIPLFLMTIWAVQRYDSGGRPYNAFLALIFMSLVYLTHLLTFGLFSVYLLCRLFYRRKRMRGNLWLLGFVALLVLLNGYFIIEALGFEPQNESISVKLLFLTFQFSHLSFRLYIISSVLFAASLYLIIRNSALTYRHFLWTSAVFLLIYLILPYKGIRGYVDVRTLLFGYLLFPLALRPRDNRSSLFVKLLLLSIFMINSYFLLFSFHDFNKNFSTECSKKIQDGSVILPVDATKNSDTPVMRYLNAWGYFLEKRQILFPYLATGAQLSIEYVNRPPAPTEWWVFHGKLDEGRNLADAIQKNYDYIILSGNNNQVEKIISSLADEICSDGLVRLYQVR